MLEGYSFLFCDDRKKENQGYCTAVSDMKAESGKPVHVAGVFDSRQVCLFIDGKRQSQTDRLTGKHAISRLALMIGADPGTANRPEHFFVGLIDEVRISSVARYTEAFTPQRRFESDEHTIALYHFDEGEGDSAFDTSGNGHHGRIFGATWVKAQPHALPLSSGERPQEMPSPPLAVAPFTAEKARQHQEAWAEYLGVPVEYEKSIGMKLVLIPPGFAASPFQEVEWQAAAGPGHASRSS